MTYPFLAVMEMLVKDRRKIIDSEKWKGIDSEKWIGINSEKLKRMR